MVHVLHDEEDLFKIFKAGKVIVYFPADFSLFPSDVSDDPDSNWDGWAVLHKAFKHTGREVDLEIDTRHLRRLGLIFLLIIYSLNYI